MNKLRKTLHAALDKYRYDEGVHTKEIVDVIMAELDISYGDYKHSDVNYNGAIDQAIRALRYIGDHGRTPSGGCEFPNDECCLQVAHELERSHKNIKKLFE